MSKKSKKKKNKQSAAKKISGKKAWKVVDKGSTTAAGVLASQVSTFAWRAATGQKPPVNGRHPDISTREAVAWAVIGGASVELTKVLVRRWTASYWTRSTGNLPPGMKPLHTTEPAPPVEEPAPKKKRAKA